MEKWMYISGKIGETQISEATREKFNRAEQEVIKNGYIPFNPTNKERVDFLTEYYDFIKDGTDNIIDFYTFVLREDIKHLAKCEAIYMLRDWQDSPGAKAEHAFAVACGMEVFYEHPEEKPYEKPCAKVLQADEELMAASGPGANDIDSPGWDNGGPGANDIDNPDIGNTISGGDIDNPGFSVWD